MKFDPKMFAGFGCALGIHAALLTMDMPKSSVSKNASDLLFEKSYSSVEISFASAPAPKPKEIKKLKKQPKQKKPEIKKPIIKELKPIATEKPDVTLPTEVKEEPKKVKPKKSEKSVLKENRGVANKIVKPVRIYNQAPVYPLFAVRMNFEGTVILSLSIDAEGIVKSVDIKKSSGHVLLDNAAKDAADNWRFTPAKKGGKNIAYKKEVPVVFRLKDAQNG